MNIELKDVTYRSKNGQINKMSTVFIRGSQVRLFLLPDLLKHANVFQKVLEAAAQKQKVLFVAFLNNRWKKTWNEMMGDNVSESQNEIIEHFLLFVFVCFVLVFNLKKTIKNKQKIKTANLNISYSNLATERASVCVCEYSIFMDTVKNIHCTRLQIYAINKFFAMFSDVLMIKLNKCLQTQKLKIFFC
ncbi:small nuclear ribonucleoprotein / snRNP / Sm protein [Reticulomyxa filosa]|uniref:Small nuclear ribonucleoprotein / snRNP / Sm protein n=1 Tax=Reticulomyxa filosa TaxID=46433 RepID=X6PBQ1_RETFI|nr:small nuclear ribonucleoprotein / snRNP / Sm protein [Reticulomyxa filosa]|eukprot:ETO35484.1 small nuclear ribonucleoprotein / snRNP / Sm protein [Reticulomyxa filosa]